jgi:hypothetical protein
MNNDDRPFIEYERPDWTPGEMPEAKPVPFVRRIIRKRRKDDSLFQARVIVACVILGVACVALAQFMGAH